MNRAFLGLLLGACVEGSAVVNATRLPTIEETEDSLSDICPVSPSHIMDDFYRGFISSDLYIESVRPQIISEERFGILTSKYGRTNRDIVGIVAGALGDTIPTTRNRGYDPHETNLGDYIVSDSVLERIEQVLALISTQPETTLSEWLSVGGCGGHEANLQLYYLYVDLSQKSSCQNLDSRLLRKFIQQVHFRLTVRDFTSYDQVSDQVIPVISSIQRELTGLVFLSGVMAGNPRPPARMRAAASAAIEVGCWCIHQCIGYYRNRSSTTTTTTSAPQSTIAAWILEGKRKQFDQFLSSANANLDEIMVQVGIVSASSDSQLENSISSLRTESMVKIVAITRGIMSFPATTLESTEILHTAFGLSDFLSQTHTNDDWSQMKRQILVTVVKMRNLLSTLPFPR